MRGVRSERQEIRHIAPETEALEQPPLELNKDISSIKKKLLELGAKNVLMSGSGSTVFAISEDKAELEVLYSVMKNEKHFIRLTMTMNRRYHG